MALAKHIGSRQITGKPVNEIYSFSGFSPQRKEKKSMRLTTTDLYESSFLHCAGAQLADVWNERSKSSTVVFVFDGDYQLEELQKSYHNGTATVNLADYRQSLEILKDAMFRLIRSANTQEKENQKPRRNRNAKPSRSYQTAN